MFAPLRTLSFWNCRPSTFPLFQFLSANPPLRLISLTQSSIHILNPITICAFQLNRTLTISFFSFFLSFENPQTHFASSSHICEQIHKPLLSPTSFLASLVYFALLCETFAWLWKFFPKTPISNSQGYNFLLLYANFHFLSHPPFLTIRIPLESSHFFLNSLPKPSIIFFKPLKSAILHPISSFFNGKDPRGPLFIYT